MIHTAMKYDGAECIKNSKLFECKVFEMHGGGEDEEHLHPIDAEMNRQKCFHASIFSLVSS
jgi:hypothetical protein